MTYIPLWHRIKGLPLAAFTGPGKVVYSFIKQGITEAEAQRVGLSWDEAVAIGPHWTMANIAKEMGLFPSVGQAKKNGWGGHIPSGYSERGSIGKKRLCLFIWNPLTAPSETNEQLLKQGGVLLDGRQLTPDETLEKADAEGKILQIGRRAYWRLTLH